MGWLLLTRKQGESIRIGDDIRVTVKEIRKTDMDIKIYNGSERSNHVVGVTNIIDITDDIRLAVRDIRHTQGSIAIDAPREVVVDREEVWKRKQREKS